MKKAEKEEVSEQGSDITGDIIEKVRGNWIEIVAAILLALATVCSAWSAYQASRWSGVQTARYSEANAERTQAVNLSNWASQEILLDATMFVDYVIAYHKGDSIKVELYEERLFRPEMKVAVEAWKSTHPLLNPDAPSAPFQMEEYKNEWLEEGEKLWKSADNKSKKAREANQQSDNYVLLTVVFASVLFFAGISTKFKAGWIKIGILLMGSVVFTGALVILVSQPIH